MSADPRIPEKSFFRIGEVAGIAGVETYVLRFWETEFETLAPAKSRTNQRRYCKSDVELVLRIRDLLYEDGFTIEGARRQLKGASVGVSVDGVPLRTQKILEQAAKEARALIALVS